MPNRRALLIANAQSRRGSDIERFTARLERGGLALQREPCASPADVQAAIRRAKGTADSVILAGGDGTMHNAAPSLMETGLTLGILPLGTANDLARSLGIGDDPDHAADIILAGGTRMIDLGTINGTPFFNVASLGLSADATRRLNGLVKRRLGPVAYPVAAAWAVLTRGRFRASLRADGTEVATRTLQIAVGNGRFYGGGAVVNRTASIDDGMLHVYSLEPRARWRLLFMARAFKEGRHDELPEVRTLTCRTLSVMTTHPHAITADGEMVGRTPAHFGVLPGALRVFAQTSAP